jgi:hypothetical protein
MSQLSVQTTDFAEKLVIIGPEAELESLSHSDCEVSFGHPYTSGT